MTMAAVAMLIAAVACLLPLTGCRRPLSCSTTTHLPDGGWLQSLPLTFRPTYPDSSYRYDLTLSVRYNNSYAYRNLALMVDVIAADGTIDRQPLDISLADAYGNWMGGGFGTLYQDAVVISRSITPADARTVVLWQVMQSCDTLHGITDLSLTLTPQ